MGIPLTVPSVCFQALGVSGGGIAQLGAYQLGCTLRKYHPIDGVPEGNCDTLVLIVHCYSFVLLCRPLPLYILVAELYPGSATMYLEACFAS